MEAFRAALILGPILGLLALGLGLTLKSGHADLHTGQGLRLAVWNLSQTVLVLSLFLAALAAVQHVVGFRLGMGPGW